MSTPPPRKKSLDVDPLENPFDCESPYTNLPNNTESTGFKKKNLRKRSQSQCSVSELHAVEEGISLQKINFEHKNSNDTLSSTNKNSGEDSRSSLGKPSKTVSSDSCEFFDNSSLNARNKKPDTKTIKPARDSSGKIVHLDASGKIVRVDSATKFVRYPKLEKFKQACQFGCRKIYNPCKYFIGFMLTLWAFELLYISSERRGFVIEEIEKEIDDMENALLFGDMTTEERKEMEILREKQRVRNMRKHNNDSAMKTNLNDEKDFGQNFSKHERHRCAERFGMVSGQICKGFVHIIMLILTCGAGTHLEGVDHPDGTIDFKDLAHMDTETKERVYNNNDGDGTNEKDGNDEEEYGSEENSGQGSAENANADDNADGKNSEEDEDETLFSALEEEAKKEMDTGSANVEEAETIESSNISNQNTNSSPAEPETVKGIVDAIRAEHNGQAASSKKHEQSPSEDTKSREEPISSAGKDDDAGGDPADAVHV